MTNLKLATCNHRSMRFLPLIESKRDGHCLTEIEIRELIADYTAGQIPDYQMAAFLMAIFFSGLNSAETAALTLAMRDSGDVLQFPKDRRPLVDKHSTGGVGDKVSLPLAPLLACLGFRVPMVSGRGLGITGGTLDKLDSIPGFQTSLSIDRIIEIVQSVGCVICGQTERMVPADKALYALRDVTGTVPSIPLIVSSILSKKLAEGLDALVLDVKFGAAAFMPSQAKALELARAMVTLGNRCGVNTRAVLTNMDVPLGRAAGNWLEIKESVTCLEPESLPHHLRSPAPASGKAENAAPSDLLSIVVSCAANLLVQTGKSKTIAAAQKRAFECLASGEPRKKWDEMLVAQGADLAAFNRKLRQDFTAPVVVELRARKSGFITRCDARIIGEIVRDLGGGRLTKESVINYDVGIDSLAKPGDKVTKGSTLARIHGLDDSQASAALGRLSSAFDFSSRSSRAGSLIAATIVK